MKTVFITIFEGVESKNILRTRILPTLLSDPDIRLVLLTKNEERIAYHKKEFIDPRIEYAAVESARPGGADAFFAKLKFLLLRTGTTKLRRRMVYEMRPNTALYYAGMAANFLLARGPIQRAVRALDYFLVRRTVYAALFEKYRPDLVVAANLFDDPETGLVREARRRGVRTLGFINSWDKTTARCMIRLLPDRFVVFNNQVKEELIMYQRVSPEAIFVGGIPQYDQYFNLKPTPRGQFFNAIGENPSARLMVYSPLGSTFSNADWDTIDFLHRLHQEGRLGENIALLVRFPPNEFIDEQELARRPWLKYDYPGVRFSRARGIDWDMTFPELAYLADTLFHMSLMICYASSISVDAAALDRPVININFEIRGNELLAKSPTQFYQMTHYKKALASGGIRLVGSEEELVVWIKKYLENPKLDRAGRQRLAQEQCAFLDGKSGERIGRHILDFLGT